MAGVADSGDLRAQLEEARHGLQRVERDIRKAVALNASARFPDRNLDRNFQNARPGARHGKQLSGQDGLNQRSFADDRQGKKRQQETKTVFSRLCTRPGGDSDCEDDASAGKKPRISSQVIRDLPTKQEILKAQEGDEHAKARNRRIFGSLLGTLQKFKQESIVLQNKEEKKARVERKIEEQAKQEKENQKKERQNLFAEREIKKATIKALESKMVRTREFERWETAHTLMLGFIQTRGKPNIFWKPKKMSDSAQDKLHNSRKNLEKMIEKKRQDVTSELNAIEQRWIRNIKLPPGSQHKPMSLFASTENPNLGQNESFNSDDDHEENNKYSVRLQRSSIVVKHEKDTVERSSFNKCSVQISSEVKQEDVERKIENGKSQYGEKWNREESNSSSDDNDDNFNKNVGDESHSVHAFSHSEDTDQKQDNENKNQNSDIKSDVENKSIEI